MVTILKRKKTNAYRFSALDRNLVFKIFFPYYEIRNSLGNEILTAHAHTPHMPLIHKNDTCLFFLQKKKVAKHISTGASLGGEWTLNPQGFYPRLVGRQKGESLQKKKKKLWEKK